MTITSSPHLAPDDVARHTFASVRRGFDPGEVRDYLESIADGLRALAERERELLQELADTEVRAANPVLDEPTLTEALGKETARVLHSAHEAAAEVLANAEAEAQRLLGDPGDLAPPNRPGPAPTPWWPSGQRRSRRPSGSCGSGRTSRWPRRWTRHATRSN